MSVSIQLENVGLTVPTYQQADRSARSLLAGLATAAFDPPRRTHRVLLEGIDLSVASGERLAILGANGAGKSTLLRVVAGAYAPSSGRVHIEGRLQSLLNVGLGFNQDATVKENVYLRGAAMGMKIREVHGLVASVLDFAGLSDRAGDRLRVLSAGQRMRLSFAITTVQQTDIMVMDEWIGTGDADFLEKARSRLMGRLEGAKIVLLASHSVPLLMRVCERAIYLDNGRIVGSGALLDVVEEFIPQALPPKRTKPPPPMSEAELQALRDAHRQAMRDAKVKQVREEMERAARARAKEERAERAAAHARELEARRAALRAEKVQAAREQVVAAARAAADPAQLEAARAALRAERVAAARAAARQARVEAARAEVVAAARAAAVEAARARNEAAAATTSAPSGAGAAPAQQASLFDAGDDPAPPARTDPP
jgi:ABC-type polysaccharide/polyol phosphate transport system ATPase subunit